MGRRARSYPQPLRSGLLTPVRVCRQPPPPPRLRHPPTHPPWAGAAQPTAHPADLPPPLSTPPYTPTPSAQLPSSPGSFDFSQLLDDNTILEDVGAPVVGVVSVAATAAGGAVARGLRRFGPLEQAERRLRRLAQLVAPQGPECAGVRARAAWGAPSASFVGFSRCLVVVAGHLLSRSSSSAGQHGSNDADSPSAHLSFSVSYSPLPHSATAAATSRSARPSTALAPTAGTAKKAATSSPRAPRTGCCPAAYPRAPRARWAWRR